MSLISQPEYIEQIRTGEKTVTRRDWAEGYARPNPGTVHAAVTELFTSREDCDCFVRVGECYKEPLGAMTDVDAQKEGDYETVAQFRVAWRAINGAWTPEPVVDVVPIAYAGREAP